MSINSAMLSGVSGLVANSAALGAISDNIANVNTVGYKRNVTQFQDLVTAAATSGSYNSGGVLAQTSQWVDQQGQLAQSTSATDLGISGQGFFVTTDVATGASSTDPRSFTRAGDFTPDSSGYLKNSAGLYLQGWMADSTGAIATDPSDLSKLSTINTTAVASIPNPTTTASLNLNLNAAQTVSTQEATYSAATPATSMAAYSATSGTGVKPDYTTQVTVYDAQGGAHTFQLDFLKSSTPNQWHAELVAIPASDVAGTTNGLVSSGVVAFKPDGTLDTANTTFSAAATAIGASSATSGVRWATSLGLPAQSVDFDLSSGAAAVTQYNSASATNGVTSDGGRTGTLTGVSIDKDGYVTAKFSSGAEKRIAQIAIATFPNPDGLDSVSGDSYLASVGSGAYTLKQAGQAGAGAVSPSTLESSTVDLSSEFTGLIITQRAYAASSKIITTADQMLQELINSKQ
jgi:flagellar hook protein FlgE